LAIGELRTTEQDMVEEDLIVIPLPLEAGGVTYAVAKLVAVDDTPFAEIIVATPGTGVLPGKRIELSRYSLGPIRPGSIGRPDLYLYEGMIMPAEPSAKTGKTN
jgi:hypothetical protein